MKLNMICIKFHQKIKKTLNFGLFRFLRFLKSKKARVFRSHFPALETSQLMILLPIISGDLHKSYSFITFVLSIFTGHAETFCNHMILQAVPCPLSLTTISRGFEAEHLAYWMPKQ